MPHRIGDRRPCGLKVKPGVVLVFVWFVGHMARTCEGESGILSVLLGYRLIGRVTLILFMRIERALIP